MPPSTPDDDGEVAYVALGSNLGDRAAWLAFGRAGLARVAAHVVAVTPVEETAPLGGLAQPAYLNQLVALRVRTTAAALLGACQMIERAAGRERGEKWASRTLDLDLVRFGDLLCDLPGLSLPHPGLRDREFWVREIAILESHV